MYQPIDPEYKTSFEIDEEYINIINSDTKERLRIVNYKHMIDGYVSVYYYKFINTHKPIPWHTSEIEWKIIDQYEKTMTYEQAKSLVIKNRDKKLERLLR